MFFLIRFLAVIAVIFYFSPERGGNNAGAPAAGVATDSLAEQAPMGDAAQEAVTSKRGDIPVDTIAAILQREFGQNQDAIARYAQERLAEEIASGVMPDTRTTQE